MARSSTTGHEHEANNGVARVASVLHGIAGSGCKPLEWRGFALRSLATRAAKAKRR